MLQLLKTHKKTVAIVCAAVLICSFLAAICVTRQIKADEQEPVPPGRIYDAGKLGDNIIVHDSAEGEIVIGADSTEPTAEPAPLVIRTISDPDAIWSTDTYAGNHTPVEKAQMKNGSIGVLTIPKLKLSVNVYESPDNMEAMSKGVAHFPSTSAFDSNVGLSAHNINLDGSDGYFKYLHTLEKGDGISYQTALGERSYLVESVTTIAASDWSPLGYIDDNRLTMITCISGQADKRLCVTAIEHAGE
ncbi:sortase [Ruminococcaceae bacterium OttesenSCG-928-L11]|nr:sortase [Ruminococcaceae bacterium OttesenSCG-928-L11]